MPRNHDYKLESNLYKFHLDEDLNVGHAERVALFFEDYRDYAVDYPNFKLNDLGPCSEYPYIHFLHSHGPKGRQDVRPCLFLKLNKIWGWEPMTINEDDFNYNEWLPQSLEEHLKKLDWSVDENRNNVFVNCYGRNPADRDAINEIEYFPKTRGFHTKYFPYLGSYNYIFESSSVYHSPLVAVQLHIDESKVGQLIHVECRVYHHTVIHDTKTKAGLIQFEVMLEE